MAVTMVAIRGMTTEIIIAMLSEPRVFGVRQDLTRIGKSLLYSNSHEMPTSDRNFLIVHGTPHYS